MVRTRPIDPIAIIQRGTLRLPVRSGRVARVQERQRQGGEPQNRGRLRYRNGCHRTDFQHDTGHRDPHSQHQGHHRGVLGAAVVHGRPLPEAIGQHIATDQGIDHEGAETARENADGENQLGIVAEERLKLASDIADRIQLRGIHRLVVQSSRGRGHEDQRHTAENHDADQRIDHAFLGIAEFPALGAHAIGLKKGARHRKGRRHQGLQNQDVRVAGR